MSKTTSAKYNIGQVIRHRTYAFRGIVFDVDPEFSDSDVVYQTIVVEARPRKDQPFYYLLAEDERTPYIAYVSEQNLLPDTSGEPVHHPEIEDIFEQGEDGSYRWRNTQIN
jgi:heat shock protein HspQ